MLEDTNSLDSAHLVLSIPISWNFIIFRNENLIGVKGRLKIVASCIPHFKLHTTSIDVTSRC